jgi:hypothetical protein
VSTVRPPSLGMSSIRRAAAARFGDDIGRVPA